MPVWHGISKPLRDEHGLAVVGLVQEQHPDRARLFAQWQGLDFPIVWDPFGVTRAKVVPRVFLIDEHGVVVKQSPTPDEVVAFARGAPEREEVSTLSAEALPEGGVVARRLGDVLWRGPEHTSALIDALTDHLETRPDDAATTHFRLGVAHRMRHDSEHAEPGDFQRAIDHWDTALALDPSQYIWRRRIQQYGPLLDKPYPFYGWVETAQREVRARGDEPVALRVPLSSTERLGRESPSATVTASPDPGDGVPHDDGSWLDVRTTVVPDTTGRAGVVRVHVEVRPRADIHWNNEVEPPVLWIAELPDGVSASPRGQRGTLPDAVISDEVRRFDVELRADDGEALADSGRAVTATLFFHACEEEVGVCIYLRRDVVIEL